MERSGAAARQGAVTGQQQDRSTPAATIFERLGEQLQVLLTPTARCGGSQSMSCFVLIETIFY